MVEYKAWPQIANLTDQVVVTEMIDGAGAFAIHIERLKFDSSTGTLEIRPGDVVDFNSGDMTFLRLTAQSRTRLITPRDDNHGFAKWVAENASGLAATLGEGIHYGEWWGYKINRGYGLAKGDKRFSLYNTERWTHLDGSQVPGLWCVPVLAGGQLLDPEVLEDEDADFLGAVENPVNLAVSLLRASGSMAAPGYDRPAGIVLFHTGGRVMFKYKLDELTPAEELKLVEVLRAAYPDGLPSSRPEVTSRGMTAAQFREEQEAQLTAIEDAAKFDIDKAYADAVDTALANIQDNPYRGGLLG